MKSAVSVLSISALLLSGCGSIMNPYVTSPENMDFLAKDQAGEDFAGGMTDAIPYAVSQHTAYINAIGERARFRNGLALSLIPLSAAGVFIGLTGSSRRSTDALTAIAVGGTGAYALGSYFDSPPLERVYINGAVTVFCAINAMRPYLISETEFGYFETDTKGLGPKISDVKRDINSFSTGGSVASGQAAALISYANTVVAKAKQVQTAGDSLAGKIGTAGVTLTSAVKVIEGQVNVQAVTLQPNLASLMTSLQGLQGGAGRLLGSLSVSPPDAGADMTVSGGRVTTGVSPVQQRMAALRGSLELLVVAANEVAYVVNSHNARIKSTETLDACKVAPLANALVVNPSETELTLKAGSSRTFAVSGGTGMPSASVVGSYGGKVTPTRSIEGNAIHFTVEADASFSGTAQLVFTDGSGTATHSVYLAAEQEPPK